MIFFFILKINYELDKVDQPFANDISGFGSNCGQYHKECFNAELQGQTSVGKETETSSSILTTEAENDFNVKLGNGFEQVDKDVSAGPKTQLIKRYVIRAFDCFGHQRAFSDLISAIGLQALSFGVLFTLIYRILVLHF